MPPKKQPVPADLEGDRSENETDADGVEIDEVAMLRQKLEEASLETARALKRVEVAETDMRCMATARQQELARQEERDRQMAMEVRQQQEEAWHRNDADQQTAVKETIDQWERQQVAYWHDNTAQNQERSPLSAPTTCSESLQAPGKHRYRIPASLPMRNAPDVPLPRQSLFDGKGFVGSIHSAL